MNIEEAIVTAAVAMLTPRQIDVLRKVAAGGDLVQENGIAYIDEERTSPQIINALIRFCAIKMDSFSKVGDFERYTISSTGKDILALKEQL